MTSMPLAWLTGALLGAALLIALARLARGPRVADRAVAVELLAVTVAVAATGLAAAFDTPALLDLALMLVVLTSAALLAIGHALEGADG